MAGLRDKAPLTLLRGRSRHNARCLVHPRLHTVTPFGTPLSPHATKVMLLGSGELGKEVLIALQRLGVETIAVDRYDHAPGQQVAHHARTITMSDPLQLKALIEAERPMLVVPEIEAIATGMLEELEDVGIARVIPFTRAARLAMDREGIRMPTWLRSAAVRARESVFVTESIDPYSTQPAIVTR